jgi:pimeloyl-ACP methyl ester carboxylesterase
MRTRAEYPDTANVLGPHGPPSADSSSRGHIGLAVVGSALIGAISVLLLAAAPFIPNQQSEMTGAVLIGFAFGWATLVWLSVRFTDQPQRWAAVPASFLGFSGLLLGTFGSAVHGTLSWLWPPALLTLVVWMAGQARHHLRSSSRRWVLYPVFVAMALAAVGGGYETVSAASDTEAAMPGQRVEVDGHQMHLSCTGSGSPTVVLQPGGGEMSSHMGWIAPRLAAETRVCVYDRPGRGWSDPVSNPQDATDIAHDLHTLLKNAEVPGPYVFAGHSFGGLYVLTHAALYPDDVAGLVLIDTTAPKDEPTTSTSGDPDAYDVLGRFSTLVSTASLFGVTRLESQTEVGTLPPLSQEEVRATLRTGHNARSFIDEFARANASMGQAALLTDFGAKPLYVLTAGVGSDTDLIATHEGLAEMSTNSVHTVVDDASHQELIADEVDSAVPTRAILAVVTAIREGEPVTE